MFDESVSKRTGTLIFLALAACLAIGKPVPAIAQTEVVEVDPPAPNGFTPRQAQTARIEFHGMRFKPTAVRTKKIRMTGLRFRKRNVKTSTIEFTGMRP